MTILPFGSGGTQSGVSLSGLGTIASGGTGISSAFTLPYVSPGSASASLVTRANLQLSCSSFTPSSNPGWIAGVFVTSDDGTNYDPYWVASNQLFPVDVTSFAYQTEYNVAATLVRVKGLVLPDVPPGGTNAKLVLFNNCGVSVTISSATLYPAGDVSG